VATKGVESPIAEIRALSEAERQQLVHEAFSDLLTTPAGLEEIDRVPNGDAVPRYLTDSGVG
jgi:hypothetical protein